MEAGEDYYRQGKRVPRRITMGKGMSIEGDEGRLGRESGAALCQGI